MYQTEYFGDGGNDDYWYDNLKAGQGSHVKKIEVDCHVTPRETSFAVLMGSGDGTRWIKSITVYYENGSSSGDAVVWGGSVERSEFELEHGEDIYRMSFKTGANVDAIWFMTTRGREFRAGGYQGWDHEVNVGSGVLLGFKGQLRREHGLTKISACFE